ncbi:MAG: hypothetical protein KUG77_28530 [Nannocystaceae bacterium]|nr:hypothetical protein [Nannocystaceae bacterium]
MRRGDIEIEPSGEEIYGVRVEVRGAENREIWNGAVVLRLRNDGAEPCPFSIYELPDEPDPVVLPELVAGVEPPSELESGGRLLSWGVVPGGTVRVFETESESEADIGSGVHFSAEGSAIVGIRLCEPVVAHFHFENFACSEASGLDATGAAQRVW